MRLRHDSLTNQEIITQFGRMTLDEDGYVVDIERPPKDLKRVIRMTPGIVDGELFKPLPRTRSPKELEIEEARAKVQEHENFKKFEREDYKNLLIQMMAEKAPVNSEGYVDMTVFNERLRALGQKVIPGTTRRKIQDEIREEEAVALAEA